jgi:hypothetical protein
MMATSLQSTSEGEGVEVVMGMTGTGDMRTLPYRNLVCRQPPSPPLFGYDDWYQKSQTVSAASGSLFGSLPLYVSSEYHATLACLSSTPPLVRTSSTTRLALPINAHLKGTPSP